MHVVRELHSVGLAAKWRQIGQTLKVSNDVMTGLRGDPSVCLLHVVYNWLSGQTRLLDRDQPSWWRVVWVVADKLGGNKQRSAREIAKKCSGVLSLRFVLHAVQKHQWDVRSTTLPTASLVIANQ